MYDQARFCRLMYSKQLILISLTLILCHHRVDAHLIPADPSNYISYLGSLMPGDTLALAAGDYTQGLNLSNRNGTASDPIVIMGAGTTTVFLGNACCNTVNITNCSFLVIRDFKIDGQNINYIDGVKAGGGANNFAHDITLENLLIVNNGGNIEGDNQTDGISTKCAAWRWIIRGCTIIAAGTGIYLGNSDGTSPFVAGLIENNLVINTRGYNMEIKAQNNGVRDIFPGTAIDSQKTIIRYNVWSKDSGGTPEGVGDGSRPCILMDHFPAMGNGSHDTYEVYGNFFYNNPTEALMQVTGNTTAYDNVFVNHVAPSGYRTVVINNHDGFPPRAMNMFHNTVLSTSPNGGIGLFNPDPGYQQYCSANAVFSNGTPISGFSAGNTVDNIIDSYANAADYVNNPSTTLSALDLYPLAGQVEGTLTDSSLFTGFTDFNIDFNGDIYDWTYRGAYSGSGVNAGWPLQLDLRPTPHGTVTGTVETGGVNDFAGVVYPNPANGDAQFDLVTTSNTSATVTLSDLQGRYLKKLYAGVLPAGRNTLPLHLDHLSSGFYLISIHLDTQTITRKILITQ